MTNEEILKKAIEKAEKGGYDEAELSWSISFNVMLLDKLYYHVIFDHSFAKAFWGEGNEDIPIGWACSPMDKPCEPIMGKTHGWQHHLQQMVICEEPLKYIEKFLEPTSHGEDK